MKEYAITFGVKYHREVHPKLGQVDPNGFIVIEAPDEASARKVARSYTDNLYAFIYPRDEINESFFPHGETDRWLWSKYIDEK